MGERTTECVGDWAALAARGWLTLPADGRVLAWARNARPLARAAAADPALAHWWVCEKTWFVGVDALPNDAAGAVPGGPPLEGPFCGILAPVGLWPVPLHRAQLSIVRPGYPRPRAGESAAAFRYRIGRDAAHVDGLKAEGPGRRRFLREWHGFILGVPLTGTAPGASPTVVREGSPAIIRRHLAPLLESAPDPSAVDLTEAYHAARREVFASCPRRELHGRRGQSWLIHPLALHGIAPWQPGVPAPPEGRVVAWFRPLHPAGIAGWLAG